MTGKEHIRVSAAITVASATLSGIAPLSEPLELIGILICSIIGSVAPDVDTYKSLAFWRNPVMVFLQKTLVVLFIISAVTIVTYEYLAELSLYRTYAPWSYLLAGLCVFLSVVEWYKPVITYYGLSTLFAGILLFQGTILYALFGALIIAIVWTGHRKITHAVDFFILLVLMTLMVEQWKIFYIAFLSGYLWHLVMDLLIGKIPISCIVNLLTRKEYSISFKVMRYDSVQSHILSYTILIVSIFLVVSKTSILGF